MQQAGKGIESLLLEKNVLSPECVMSTSTAGEMLPVAVRTPKYFSATASGRVSWKGSSRYSMKSAYFFNSTEGSSEEVDGEVLVICMEEEDEDESEESVLRARVEVTATTNASTSANTPLLSPLLRGCSARTGQRRVNSNKRVSAESNS